MFLINYFIKGNTNNTKVVETRDEPWELINPEEVEVLGTPKKPSPSLVLSNNFTTSHYEEIEPNLIVTNTANANNHVIKTVMVEIEPSIDLMNKSLQALEPELEPLLPTASQSVGNGTEEPSLPMQQIQSHQPKKHSRQLELQQQLFPKGSSAQPSKRKRDIVKSGSAGASGTGTTRRSGKYKQSFHTGKSNDRKTGSRGF